MTATMDRPLGDPSASSSPTHAHEQTMSFTLRVWRQSGPRDVGGFADYRVNGITGDMSFLEMIDIVNEQLNNDGVEPITFDHDCREGICGSCAMYINGRPHGPIPGIATCQLHMRSFHDGDTIVVEPWRAAAFPVLKDLAVDRSAFDRIVSAGGFISINTGNAQDANSLPIPKDNADEAFMSAACIGCGACVAACKNASAMLFVSAKISQLALLPQGQAERQLRAEKMVAQMDAEGFGACTNTGACSAECPKGISMTNIARMNREYIGANVSSKRA